MKELYPLFIGVCPKFLNFFNLLNKGKKIGKRSVTKQFWWIEIISQALNQNCYHHCLNVFEKSHKIYKQRYKKNHIFTLIISASYSSEWWRHEASWQGWYIMQLPVCYCLHTTKAIRLIYLISNIFQRLTYISSINNCICSR